MSNYTQNIETKGIINTHKVNHFIAKNIKPESVVIDLGCGKGDRLHFISSYLNMHSLGVEIFGDYVESARSKNLTVVQTSIKEFLSSANLPSNNSINFILIDVIEHLSDEDADFCVGKMKEIGSKILIFTPEGDFDQDPYDGNVHQKHLSVWDRIKLEKIGFTCEVEQDFHIHADGRSTPVVYAVWSSE